MGIAYVRLRTDVRAPTAGVEMAWLCASPCVLMSKFFVVFVCFLRSPYTLPFLVSFLVFFIGIFFLARRLSLHKLIIFIRVLLPLLSLGDIVNKKTVRLIGSISRITSLRPVVLSVLYMREDDESLSILSQQIGIVRAITSGNPR